MTMGAGGMLGQSLMDKVANKLIGDIENGKYELGQQIPSINVLARELDMARDTVERAYRKLRSLGYVKSVPGSGYFVCRPREAGKAKVLCLTDRLTDEKQALYNEITRALDGQDNVDLQTFQNRFTLDSIILNYSDKYQYFVLITVDATQLQDQAMWLSLRNLPADKVILLGPEVFPFSPLAHIYQDGRRDIFNMLMAQKDRLTGLYQEMVLLSAQDYLVPLSIREALFAFCCNTGIKFRWSNSNAEPLAAHTLFITYHDGELFNLLNQLRTTDLAIGKDVGIITFNDNIFKEFLNLTVITPDFRQAGKTIQEIVNGGQEGRICNPFQMVLRLSI